MITIFGGIWIVAIILCFLLRTKWLLAMAFFAMIFQSNNVFVVGNVGIGPQAITVLATLFKLMLFYRGTPPSDKTLSRLLLMLLVTILLSSWFSNQEQKVSYMSLVLIIVYILFSVRLLKLRFVFSQTWLQKVEDFIIVFVLIVGYIQFFTVALNLPLKPFLTAFFYNDVQNQNVIFNHKNVKALYSTFMEPSYCGAFLVGAFFHVLQRKRHLAKKRVYLFVILIAILLTKSSTAYVGFGLMALLTVFMRNERKSAKFLILLLIIGGFILVFFFNDYMNIVLFDKMNTASFRVRSRWNQWAWERFLTSPVLGVGYGNSRASSLLLTVLSELGLFGFFLLTFLILYFLKPLVSKKITTRNLDKSMMILGVLICQLIACPDMNFSPFWLSIFMYSTSVSCVKSNIKRSSDYESRHFNIP